MCVVTIAWRASPRWRLVVAGNRDERHARPAAALARWEGEEHILAGRDLLSGGTWLGVSEAGRFAVVTNVRGGPTEPAPRSRGALVADFLRGDSGPDETSGFNAFNLITVGGGEASLLSNHPPGGGPMAPGIHGLANGELDAPWPKTLRLNASLAEWLATGDGEPEDLLVSLLDTSIGRGGGDPDSVQSPIFILDPLYGTRCSTIVAIDEAGEGVMMERRFDTQGKVTGETHLQFRWPTSAGS